MKYNGYILAVSDVISRNNRKWSH